MRRVISGGLSLIALLWAAVASAAPPSSVCVEQGGPELCEPLKPSHWRYSYERYSPPRIDYMNAHDLHLPESDWRIAATNELKAYASRLDPCFVSPIAFPGWASVHSTWGGYSDTELQYPELTIVYPAHDDYTANGIQTCIYTATIQLYSRRDRIVYCDPGYQMSDASMPPISCVPRNSPKNRGRCRPGERHVGNPINVGTGNKYQIEIDYQGAGAFPLTFQRSYNSDGGDGTHWRHNYGPTVVPNAAGTIAYVYRPDGRILVFRLVAGHWLSDGDVSDRLMKLTDGWTYAASESNQVETYDVAGRLTSVRNPALLAQTLTYSDETTPGVVAPGPGYLIRVTDSAARTLSFTYYTDGRIKSLTDPAGGIYAYGYETSRNFASVTYPDGKTRTYLYEHGLYTSALTGIVDENGSRYATYGYNAEGRAVSSEHAGGVERVAVDYAPYDSLPKMTDALGITRTYGVGIVLGVAKSTATSQPAGSGCNASSSAITYDANGNVASRTDFASHKTCYANDLTRNLETKRVEGLSSGADCTTSLTAPPTPTTANPVRTVSTAWHPDWRLEAKRAEPKKLTTWIYNGQPDPFAGNAIAACAPSTALLPDGKPIAVLCKKVEQATTDATGASGFAATATGNPRVSTWTYNGYGQVLTANGPRTDVDDTTTYSYYPSTDFSDPAAGHTLGDLWKVTNPAGHVTEYLAYDKNGRLLKTKDPNGLVTTMTYWPRGWLKTRQVGDELTTYDYDAVGQLKKVTAPDGSWIGFDYDPAHRLVATYDNRNNRIAYTLDNAGNRIKEDVTDPAGYLVRTQTRVYDALSRLQNVIQPQ